MSELNLFYGPNAGFAQELYDRYRNDPSSVDAATRAFFDTYALPFEDADRPGAPPASTQEGRAGVASTSAQTSRSFPARSIDSGLDSGFDPTDIIRKTAAAARLSRLIRQRGHLIANVDPLGLSHPEDPQLELTDLGLTEADLASLPSSVVVGSPLAEQSANALEAIQRLRQIYTGTIGYDDEHLTNNNERYWLREAADSGRYFDGFDAETKRELLQRLIEVDAFEQSIHKRLPTEKRFSIEGTDVVVPMLDEIIRRAAVAGTREVVMGMAHRGRLNVLAHVLGKSFAAVLEGFKGKPGNGVSVSGKGETGYSGDVKYHLGYKRAFQEAGVAEMPITLVPNPSHLEFVNPVAEGHARAAQETRTTNNAGAPPRDPKASLPILIHGDAAFPGQGVVPETLNMSRLPGYATGGTLHIISNNQIGFTTLPSEGRSTQYASDLAKGFEIPIVHVNADDPLACLGAARLALDYRIEFGKDFLIDLIGYRRYGHNEAEEPGLTQPQMYATVAAHLRPCDVWAQALIAEGLITADEVQAMRDAANLLLDEAWNVPVGMGAHAEAEETVHSGPRYAETAVSADRLTAYNTALYTIPEGFSPDEKLNRRTLQGRRDALGKEDAILWGHAEALAFASILAEGTPIRITGQDTERGTFSHRHAVLHDIHTDARFTALQTLPQAKASFAIHNSPLSEQAVLGFEYGYSIHAPETLVLWEAQFGDFSNGAQVIIDQFLAASRSKWRQSASLVMLLPHGYEGQGPEHSSARLERYLQLAAQDNLRIANCTTPAQYFHLLRRQAALLTTDPRPLIVMTPKSLLRAPVASSSLADLTQGTFQPVIDDVRAQSRSENVTRLVLCSGKVYLDLVYKDNNKKDLRPEYEQATGAAVVRVEELYPFPLAELRTVLSHYPNLREIVWLQEEPRNMGAWTYISDCLRDELQWAGALLYRGRAAAASPAEGSKDWHVAEQARLLRSALEGIPPVMQPIDAVEKIENILETRERVATK